MNDAQLVARILRSIAHLLRSRPLSESLADPAVRSDVEMAEKLLGVIARRISGGARHEAHAAAVAGITLEACDLLNINAPLASAGLRLWNNPSILVGQPPSPSRFDDSILARLAATLDDTEPTETARRARELFRRFAKLEGDYTLELDPDAGGGTLSAYSRAPAGKSDESRSASSPDALVEIDADTLTRYLRRRFTEAPDIHAINVRKLPGGFSKETTLFEIRDGGSWDGAAIMRKDAPVPGLRGSAIDEFALLRHAWTIGVPVPEPLWAEADAHWFDGAFIVVKKVAGSNAIDWATDVGACRRFADQLAAALVKIHAIRPADLDVADQVPASARDAQLQHIAWEREHYRTSVEQLNPRIEAAYGWLMHNLPEPNVREPSLVHAGLGFHNLMMRNGDLTAILDWELAHFGDPADDLGYMRLFIEKIMPWEEFTSRYIKHGGSTLRPEQERFYAVWRNLRNASGCAGSKSRYLGGTHESVKLAYSGVILGPRFELQALREIEAAIEHSSS